MGIGDWRRLLGACLAEKGRESSACRTRSPAVATCLVRNTPPAARAYPTVHLRDSKHRSSPKGCHSLLPSYRTAPLFYATPGISGKSQILFLVVYISRYLDLFFSFVSLYNTVMKVLFISASCATVYLIFVKFKATYDGNHDTFRIEFVLVPAVILALVWHYDMSFFEV